MANDLRAGLIAAGEMLGVSPVALGTATSYETGGTFDPWQRGPTTKWGTHRGLIQFGEPQAKKYGAFEGQSAYDQLTGPVVAYLKEAGVQPGMGLLDIYSAINAGRVGRYNASDAAAGGAPGTVADKVRDQMGGHEKKALAVLGGNFTPAMPDGTNDAAPSAPFGFRPPAAGGDAPAPQAPAAAPDDTADIAAILRTLMPRQQEQPAAVPQETPAAAPMPMPEPMAAPQFDAARAFALLPATARRRA